MVLIGLYLQLLERKQSKYGIFFSNSRADNSEHCGPITSIIEPVRNLMVTYILAKFGSGWLIFVDAMYSVNMKNVNGRQTDGQTDDDRR